eukprot:scaffold33844_cov101-Isochrysis_galbana.AAC.6
MPFTLHSGVLIRIPPHKGRAARACRRVSHKCAQLSLGGGLTRLPKALHGDAPADTWDETQGRRCGCRVLLHLFNGACHLPLGQCCPFPPWRVGSTWHAYSRLCP